ncbi:HMG_box domain-containing protein [Cephalotus follicularis]|uniref:HMG_box domain-containing protein n=1 Tax=Cephalotus follicularis TaxID=3775 RepID=A0A1Q3BEK0_CEPFO|nr:HMG_box domain-containing protein [Cephalotus follicularis]
MAKKSKSVSSSSTSPASASKDVVLRMKSTRNATKKLTGQCVVTCEKEKRPMSIRKPKSKQRNKVKKVDTKLPKKPPTAFFYFLEDFRKEFQEQNPDVKSMRDIGKACGERWKTMTYEEKVQYYDIATEKRANFDRAMAEYIKRKESGEYQETDDDSEFDEY